MTEEDEEEGEERCQGTRERLTVVYGSNGEKIYSHFLHHHPKFLRGALTLQHVHWLALPSGPLRAARAAVGPDVYQSRLVARGQVLKRHTLLISLRRL